MKGKKVKNYIRVGKAFVVIFIAAGLIKLLVVQQIKIVEGKSQITKFKQQLSDVQKTKKNCNDQLKIINSKAYLEKVAREKYDMVKPGDVIFEDTN